MRVPLLVVLGLALLPLASGAGDGVERSFDARGRLVAESGPVPGTPGLGYARHYVHADSAVLANDCASTAYKLARWRWAEPYGAVTTAYAGQLAAALGAWDAETSRTLAVNVTLGRIGTAGVYDGVNQLDWVDLGATSTIAVTTTWFSRSAGIAVESDGQYNTRFAWSSSGALAAMDAQNILTHEVGHTLGLDHPKGKGADCLTMYAYASAGETAKRTLGAGDQLGIRALYGS